MKTLPLTQAKDELSSLIREAETEDVLITRHGRPAAIVIGFADEDAWIEYRLLHDDRFLQTIDRARGDIKAGRFTTLEDLE